VNPDPDPDPRCTCPGVEDTIRADLEGAALDLQRCTVHFADVHSARRDQHAQAALDAFREAITGTPDPDPGDPLAAALTAAVGGARHLQVVTASSDQVPLNAPPSSYRALAGMNVVEDHHNYDGPDAA
jgi:hypothetical protein